MSRSGAPLDTGSISGIGRTELWGSSSAMPHDHARPVMLDQYGPRVPAEHVSHLEAMHAHQLAQSARQIEAQARQIARLHQDLAMARSEIDRLTVLLHAAGAQLHDGPELETP